MARKPSKKTIKKKAWAAFSEYIRRKYSDMSGYCRCVTCGKIDHWKNMDAGHAVGGRNNAVLFHEEIVHPQCKYCNIFKHGNYGHYALFMIDTYGRDRYEELLALKTAITKLSERDLVEITAHYLEEIGKLP